MCSVSAVLHLDHVVLLVRDVDTSAARLSEQFGLESCDGDTLTSGTRTRIVPLQLPQYIELLGVVRGGDTPLTSWLASRLAERGDHFAAWAVRADDIEREAARLNSTPESGHGATLRWRTLRPDVADADHLPFFIEYDGDSAMEYLRAQAQRVNSPARPGGFAWLEVATDSAALAAWLGPNELPIRIASGPRGVRAAAIDSPSGILQLRIG